MALEKKNKKYLEKSLRNEIIFLYLHRLKYEKYKQA